MGSIVSIKYLYHPRVEVNQLCTKCSPPKKFMQDQCKHICSSVTNIYMFGYSSIGQVIRRRMALVLRRPPEGSFVRRSCK
jgi:hypothetical protein